MLSGRPALRRWRPAPLLKGNTLAGATASGHDRNPATPDLHVAFNAALRAFESSNDYIVEEQGNPPDFLLEIAAEHTGSTEVGRKWAVGYALRHRTLPATIRRPKILFHNSRRGIVKQGDLGAGNLRSTKCQYSETW